MAFRNIIRHRTRSIAIGFLISFSAAAVLIATTFSNTVNTNMIHAVTGSSTGNIQIHNEIMKDIDIYTSPVAETPLFADADRVISLLDIKGVKNIAPRLRLQGLFMTDTQSTATVLTGITPEIEKEISYKLLITDGNYIKNKNGIIIGKNLQEELGIKVGQTIRYYNNDTQGNVVSMEFLVDGVFTSDGLSLYMDNYVFGDIDYIRENIGYQNGEVTEVVIQLENSANREDVLKEINQILDAGDLKLRADKWEDVAKTYSSVILATSLIPGAVVGLVFFVVIIGLFNTIIMGVLERTKESKILFAIGTSRLRLVFMYLSEYFLLGLLSTIVTTILCVPLILFFGKIGIQAKLEIVEYIFGGSRLYIHFDFTILLFTILLFTIFPALIASIISFKTINRLELVNIN